MTLDPAVMFPDFYDNTAVRALAATSRWTISGQLGDLNTADQTSRGHKKSTRKAPIDLRELIDHQRVRGAWSISSTCLTDLEELSLAVPRANNVAFYLQAAIDGFTVIDIEPDCPPDVAADLLRLPKIGYRELSMSGRGFHLLTPLPQNFYDFSVAAGKRVLKHRHGWYEILLDHWVTFTRTPVPPAIDDHVKTLTRPSRIGSVEDLYALLAAGARKTMNASAQAIGTDEKMPKIANAKTIVAETTNLAKPRLRSLEDFDHDTSRWEFSVLATLYYWMQISIQGQSAVGVPYTTSDKTWLLYQAARQVIPHRAKHDQRRNNRPFLLDRAAALIAERQAAARV